VQAMMPSPSELSPPSVVEGKDYKLILPRCAIMNEVHFRYQEEPFNIVVFEAITGGHTSHLVPQHHSEEPSQ